MAPGHRILAPAYPMVSGISEMLDGVEALLAEERIRPDILYGGSFGGMFAQSWMRRHPEELKHIILSGCGAPEPARARQNRKWLKLLPWIPMSLMRAGLRFALRKLLRDVTQDRDAWRADYLEQIEALQRGDLASRYRVSIDFDENNRWTPQDAKSWPGKILILEGGADRIAGPRIRKELRALYPQAAAHTIPEAGHSLLLSHPEQIQRAVQAWLKLPR
ncbi:MAG TPA: alpha/beta hydrolase [Acidobacteriota bacterium]|nr:alpha/beta hydrolase [Acidobacteriota bacterium]